MKRAVLPVVLSGFVFAVCIPHSVLQVPVSPTDVSGPNPYDFRQLTDAELADITGRGLVRDVCYRFVMTEAGKQARGLPRFIKRGIALVALTVAYEVCEPL